MYFLTLIKKEEEKLNRIDRTAKEERDGRLTRITVTIRHIFADSERFEPCITDWRRELGSWNRANAGPAPYDFDFSIRRSADGRIHCDGWHVPTMGTSMVHH